MKDFLSICISGQSLLLNQKGSHPSSHIITKAHGQMVKAPNIFTRGFLLLSQYLASKYLLLEIFEVALDFLYVKRSQTIEIVRVQVHFLAYLPIFKLAKRCNLCCS